MILSNSAANDAKSIGGLRAAVFAREHEALFILVQIPVKNTRDSA